MGGCRLATSDWLLAAGNWQLAVILAISGWRLAAGCSIYTGSWLLATGGWLFDYKGCFAIQYFESHIMNEF
jgi:hypothetical protein